MSEAALRRGRRLPEDPEPAAGMVELDGDLVARRVNGACARLFGTTPDDLIGTRFPGWFPPAVQETVRRGLAELVAGRTDAFDERLAGPVSADVAARAITGADGEVGLVLLLRPVEPADPVRLSGLDVRILEGLAAGEPTVRIAMRLYLSRQAVDYRIGAMLRRLEAPSRAALVSKAYAAGLLCAAHWPPRVAPHARDD
ncbi:PAS domain-containing protein [Amycolatopsis kentuckyensis]|uniref:PAS domain-containing protein n=1 Tax=Amycolatopsis kentuckyensis TaxID=218823 RepID=UPI001ABF0D51|nr:PAS domain-containing protein [Amycolatopsis kentuckyensis]